MKLYESHTPFEWQLQRMMADVEPWGDHRADLRMAVSTTPLIVKGIANQGEMFEQIFNLLANYAKQDKTNELEANANVLAKINERESR